jgi:phosphoglycolate phosphatase-like HAD superfamily hydrolase
VRAVAIDLDQALGDTRPLWEEFLADAARRFATIAPLDPERLPRDRGDAAAELDRWAAQGVGDWRGALTRFAEDRAAVFLRPNAEANAALRTLSAVGYRIGVFTDAPEELARIALSQLGAARRVEALEAGSGARERLLARLGTETEVASSRDDLVRISSGGAEEPGRPSA